MAPDNEIGKRFKLVRKHYKFTMSEIAKRICVTQPTISHIENGFRNPSPQTVKMFCDAFGVNKTWMETGEGEMFAEETNSETEAIVREYGLGASGAALIRAFAELMSMLDKEMQEQAFRSIYQTLQSSVHQLDENPESMIVAEEPEAFQEAQEPGNQVSK